MSTKRLAVAALVCVGCASAAKADAPLVYCDGTTCGGDGPRQYAYPVDSASFPMVAFCVGTNDLDAGSYANVLSPPGWHFAVECVQMMHMHGTHTPHGSVSPGPCRCLTAGSVRWWTDDPNLAVEFFTFGYDHAWPPEDVGWELRTAHGGSPGENWTSPVGTGYGPLHGPTEPDWNCWDVGDCDPNYFCRKPDGACLGPGTCETIPEGCVLIVEPVCGCDGRTYNNACEAARVGVSVDHWGPCDMVAAGLIACEPPADSTLPRDANNVIVLSFDNDIVAPGAAPLHIVPVEGGCDIAASFAYSAPSLPPYYVSVLKVREVGQVLNDRTWYRITPAGGFNVQPFEVYLCTLRGDADNSGRVTTADYTEVKAHLGDRCASRYDPLRADLDGSQRVTTADYIVVKHHMGHQPPLSP